MTLSVETKARLAFVTVLLTCIGTGLAWYYTRSSEYTIYQIRTRDAVSGLIANAPVEFHGVEVGTVKRVELIDPRAVAILLSIKKTAPITEATIATITARGLATRGFTGYVCVDLEDTGADMRPIAAPPGSPFPLIRTAPSKAMNLDTTIGQVNDSVRTLTALLQALLDERTIASLKQSVHDLRGVAGTLASNDQRLRSIIVNAEQGSDQVKNLLESSRDAVDVLRSQILPEAYSATANLNQLSSSLSDSAGKLDPLLESMNDTVRTLQTQILPEAYQAAANLDHFSGSLSVIADRVNRDPSVLVRGGSGEQPGPGERN